jgi:predicted lipoprotein with Yx(FWY)xxD motif
MSERSPETDAMPPPTPADVSLFEESGIYLLRSKNDMSIYRYDLDKDGKSHCIDSCSDVWPPFMASEGATSVVDQWKTIPRGAARQWTYKGAPIYTYAKDTPGTKMGDGIDGLWHVLYL